MSLDLRAIIHPLLLPDRWLESGGNMYNSDYDVDNHYWYDRKHFYPKNIRNEMDKTKSIEMKLKIENRWLGWEQSHRQSLRNVKCDIWMLSYKRRSYFHDYLLISPEFLSMGKFKFYWIFKVTFKSFVSQFGFGIVLDLMKKYDPYHYIYESWGKDLGGNSWDVVFIFRKYLIWNF